MKLSDKHAIWLIRLGIVSFSILSVIFVWNEFNSLSLKATVNAEKISGFGSILSGLVGTLWSLASVILFYVALTEQRKDMQVNQRALELQTAALTQQIKEFELQTKELEATREVYLEQSKTQQLQRFEATFFQMITLHHNIVNSMALRNSEQKVARTGRDSFRTLYLTYIRKKDLEFDKFGYDAVELYRDFFSENQEILSHYFRNLYRILKFVDRAEIEDKKFYAGLIRAQISTYEIILLFYNGLTSLGIEKAKPLLEKYEMFKNIDFRHVIGGREIVMKYNISAFGHFNTSFLDNVHWSS